MIRTLAVTEDSKIIMNLSIEKLNEMRLKWFWVDFENPNEEEISLLEHGFQFHPLAIEDCLYMLQRPKLDYYEGYIFFVVNALNKETLEAEEIDFFVGKNYVVSVHLQHSSEMNGAWNKVAEEKKIENQDPIFIAHLILDKITDEYFPAVFQIENKIDQLEDNEEGYSIRVLIDKVFDIRKDLIKIRRLINSMRDLLYRILNSSHLKDFHEQKLYFDDIYDHLLKLSEMVESNLEITSDMRDSYLAMNSNRMNSIMMLLTVITTIFIPLTFIAGIYGMNFRYMPELEWRYGYFAVLGLMGMIGGIMFIWFKRKGWFDIYK
ncbi:magnesium transporter [Anaerosolibacter carboniphilus]|uniref:Magnesium transport protein CorA n=1 Tax=Anaerosolibacter carboniphilus TaxID=1417629 RepID=A0A841KSV1_9FIRM|nr:magnesium/cobalt transporter CorA [Anaerosolibacter carboniphilus]MBB6216804.1 magnesium transporter [Anaerosolibacter carboniphilus]